MFGWSTFSCAMDPATDEVGRKIQAALDENAQRKKDAQLQKNSNAMAELGLEGKLPATIIRLQPRQEPKNLPRIGSVESVNTYIADLRAKNAALLQAKQAKQAKL